MDPNQEVTPGIVKGVLFAFSIAFGFAAKLANMNKKKGLLWKEFLYQLAITICAAWIMWNLFKIYKVNEFWTYVGAVFVGKFGDQIFVWVWDTIKYHVRNKKDNL